MNKQELIDILENLECSTESLSYDNGYEQGVYDSLSHVILLDEPKKVVVPKFVAEWIELCKRNATLSECLNGSYSITNQHSEIISVDEDWITTDDNEELLARAWLNGYEVEQEPAIHELKILPEYFEAVVSGNKRFEIRKNDRNYKKGDILRLNEYQDGQYTGDVHVAEITYITDYAQQDGYVVLGIK
ncbi:MAG: DUF3850 domain-containing protein [Streptococcus vestibularis]|uniref:DUF3850 domain-containing protein n=1 Tax=Lactobacillales TaxID=186826 RepID=UPI000C129F66|nr:MULTISPECIES: DUF3850 domain-containing protein [Lactobacillales]MDU1715033.1 DUF3850 domain-containing protein [Streptococcus vestibularis]TXW24508.1 DUF3850 domain-containing protein [Enterococcus faecalis]DAM95823.1 MAG TPA: activating signal cointegrator [Caudoviricetes sp.]HAP3605981.1 DUF3850 domain-containing protein [Enterococcus faecalis]